MTLPALTLPVLYTPMACMPRSNLSMALLSLLCSSVACATSSQPPTMVIAPTTPAPSAPPAAPRPPQDEELTGPADASSASNEEDGGAPARFRACGADSDCVAVPRVGCCHNGWKEAVAASQKDAYAASFVCPDPHPVCAMYLIRDAREPQCDRATRLCRMMAK
jgi:hypothetical protein